jgi:hypothetical protein
MTDTFRATPEQWDSIERCADGSDPYSCILELRARIEALEAAQQPHQDKLDRLIALDADDGDPIVLPSSLGGSLVDRVAKAIYDAPSGAHAGWRSRHPRLSEGRAAILEVAAWLTENYVTDAYVIGPPHQMLRDEANR